MAANSKQPSFGVKHNPIHGPSYGIGSAFTRFAANGAEANARDGLTYSHLITFQEASGSLVDLIGSADLDVLTATNHAQPSPFGRIVGHEQPHNTGSSARATSGGEYDPAAGAFYLQLLCAIGQPPGGGTTRDLWVKGSGAPRLNTGIRTSDGAYRGQIHDSTGVGLQTLHVEGDHAGRVDLYQFLVDPSTNRFAIRSSFGESSVDITGSQTLTTGGAFRIGAGITLAVEQWSFEMCVVIGAGAEGIDLATQRARTWGGV